MLGLLTCGVTRLQVIVLYDHIQHVERSIGRYMAIPSPHLPLDNSTSGVLHTPVIFSAHSILPPCPEVPSS